MIGIKTCVVGDAKALCEVAYRLICQSAYNIRVKSIKEDEVW